MRKSAAVRRRVFEFSELGEVRELVSNDWQAVRGLLGGKGANLADMAARGLPVPPGFTLTTEACSDWLSNGGMPSELWQETTHALSEIERRTKKTLGGRRRPLLVAVRSGASVSMPGMMDTVLNVGMNDDVVKAMVSEGTEERFVLDSYRRLIQMFSTVVLEIDGRPFEEILVRAAQLDAGPSMSVEGLRDVVGQFHDVVEHAAGRSFPTSAREQLAMSIDAVFRSWNSKRATDYRNATGTPHDLGTAVSVVAMVFGNSGPNSGTGVAMSRSGSTGAPNIEGDFLVDAQGEDVVGGARITRPIAELDTAFPGLATELSAIGKQLESRHRDMQDLEFTIEHGKLWLLQTRDGKRSPSAAVRIAVDLADEGVISRSEALCRVTPEQVESLLHPRFSRDDLEKSAPLASGLDVSPGAAVGKVVFDPDRAQNWAEDGTPVVLVRHETKPDDVHGMIASVGLVTSTGGRTSHAALVARQFGIPAVSGASGIDIDLAARCFTVGQTVIAEGDWVSVDGSTGMVYAGRVPTVDADMDNPWLVRLLEWADSFRVLRIRTNSDDADDAAAARASGAEGIGLCRTEHMFFERNQLRQMQRMITAESPVDRQAAIDALLPQQRQDFVALLSAMDGLPVNIRLLDPPLHEFLPTAEELERMSRGDDGDDDLRTPEELEQFGRRVAAMRESNPMLGLRGARLGVTMPELTKMQVRAIIEAAVAVHRAGGHPRPEIMVPLVSDANELKLQREVIDATAAEVMSDAGVVVEYRVGTMIEVPRSALTASAIAQHADFVSFGTNDLTQMTYAMSRDDAEKSFLRHYLENGVFSQNPFVTLDREGVGQLMRLGLAGARATSPTIGSGVCGEHGGEPESIAMCHEIGVDYVSCSARRIPVARLAAAQAALNGSA